MLIPKVNLAARCQTVGKLEKVKELANNDVTNDRVICTITTDIATFDANSQIANSGPQSNIDHATSSLALDNVYSYTRHVIEGVPLQGIGNVDVAVTFVTENLAQKKC